MLKKSTLYTMIAGWMLGESVRHFYRGRKAKKA